MPCATFWTYLDKEEEEEEENYRSKRKKNSPEATYRWQKHRIAVWSLAPCSLLPPCLLSRSVPASLPAYLPLDHIHTPGKSSSSSSFLFLAYFIPLDLIDPNPPRV